MGNTPEVLFVCVHNAGRSIAASVLLDKYANGKIAVSSAGSNPSKEINPTVAEVLRERGLDPSKQFPKPLTDSATQQADVVITMGCGDACAIYPGKRYLDWDLEDPSGKSIDEVRKIVDQIEEKVLGLVKELTASYN